MTEPDRELDPQCRARGCDTIGPHFVADLTTGETLCSAPIEPSSVSDEAWRAMRAAIEDRVYRAIQDGLLPALPAITNDGSQPSEAVERAWAKRMTAQLLDICSEQRRTSGEISPMLMTLLAGPSRRPSTKEGVKVTGTDRAAHKRSRVD